MESVTMTQELLLSYLSGFPEQIALTAVFFFLPLKKKARWYLFLPLAALMLAGVVFLDLYLFQLLPITRNTSQYFFALHFLLSLAALGAGLCLMTDASPREAAYCMVLAYMTQHLHHCLPLNFRNI